MMKPTTEKGFREKIRESARTCGTYRPEFEPLISRLAEIYVRTNRAKADYEKDGSRPVIERKNKSGDTILVKNPLLSEIDNLFTMATAMERELGLTPAGLKKLNEAELHPRKQASGFAAALEQALSGAGD